MSKFPTDLKYTNEHEWVRVEGDIAVVGITSYAAEQLGGVTFVEFPETGMQVEQMDVLGSIESYKGFSDLFSPVSGEVVEVNSALEDSWEKIDQDSYGEGWLVKIKMADKSGLDSLLDVEAYTKLVESAQ